MYFLWNVVHSQVYSYMKSFSLIILLILFWGCNSKPENQQPVSQSHKTKEVKSEAYDENLYKITIDDTVAFKTLKLYKAGANSFADILFVFYSDNTVNIKILLFPQEDQQEDEFLEISGLWKIMNDSTLINLDTNNVAHIEGLFDENYDTDNTFNIINDSLVIVDESKGFVWILGVRCDVIAYNDPAQRITQMEDIMKMLQSGVPNKIIYQSLYFHIFPETYEEFTAIFGYQHDSHKFIKGPKYSDARHYVNTFFKLLNNSSGIDSNTFYKKIIYLTQGAKWQADAVNYLQKGIKEIVYNDTHNICKVLNKEDDAVIKEFWLFYFDGFTPKGPVPSIVDALCNERISDLMVEAYNEVHERYINYKATPVME